MIDYNTLYKEAKKILSEKRFIHSEGVVKRAIEYAKIYGVDIEQVKLAAIAHDIAKERSIDETLEYGVELDEIEKKNINLVHAKYGAEICKREYGFTNEMIDAVKYHTTGKANMTILQMIIYLADATEENRNYDGDYYINLCKTDINRAMYEICKWSVGRLLERDFIIHPDSIDCYNYYLDKINKEV